MGKTALSPVICLIGPTASGKTALAFALADRYPVHLISVDSAQIYRGMNIGSAKPDAATLARTRFAEKGAARKAIAEELRRKGLGEEHIRSALGQIGFDDEADAALALARKKLAATRGLDPLVRRRRALAMLGRKGYSHEVAMRAIEQALAGPD